jgi:hypothetical protein
MKYLLLCFVTILSLSVADAQPNEKSPAQGPELRKEHEEKRDENGKVNAYVDTVFRDNVKVMLTVTMLTKNKYRIKMTRAYFANGKNVVDEIHYDDGAQVIRLYQDDILCEEFRRQPDGLVTPVSGEELAKLKGQQKELMETLKK